MGFGENRVHRLGNMRLFCHDRCHFDLLLSVQSGGATSARKSKKPVKRALLLPRPHEASSRNTPNRLFLEGT